MYFKYTFNVFIKKSNWLFFAEMNILPYTASFLVFPPQEKKKKNKNLTFYIADLLKFKVCF